MSNVIGIQCTNLKDTNNKLIYEGDIIELEGKIRGEVKFGEYKTYDLADITHYGFYVNFSSIDKICTIIDAVNPNIYKQCQVVGNIYENPELLNNS
jgi:uncharacterized phage protein (TIGR01671 family)